jgi:TonB family protein
VNDPVLRVLASRQALADEGYSKSLLLSGAAHTTTCLAVLIVALLTPSRKIINVIDGFAVPLPKGGGIPRVAAPQPVDESSAREAAETAPKAAAKPPAPAKLIKPEATAVKKGLAPVDLKKSVKEPPKAESREIATEKVPSKAPQSTAAAPVAGVASAATGLDFTAQMPGVSDGTAGPTGPLGFYLAAVKNKIWATWARQIRPDLAGNVKVAFTIHRDGSVDEVSIVESSGSPTIDRLAERAVISTQLGPLPNSYDKETLVVHANFKPIP